MPSPTALVDIAKYKTKFTSYPPELTKFATDNCIKLPGIDSLKGQAYALMSQPEIRGKKHISRTEAIQFFKQIGMDTDDAIQPFNKALGLKRVKTKGIYALIYPFEADKTDIDKRAGCVISGDKDKIIDHIKQWWRDNLVDVPNSVWQKGHLDPTIPTAEDNLAWQPPIQGKYRNKFKWDAYFHRMWPTADEWIAKMNDYHTDAEQKKMLAALKAKWE